MEELEIKPSDRGNYLIEKMLNCPDRGIELKACMEEICVHIQSLKNYSGYINNLQYFSILYIEKLLDVYNHKQMQTFLSPLLDIFKLHINSEMIHAIGEHLFSYLDSQLHDLKKEQLLLFYLQMLHIAQTVKNIEAHTIFPISEMILYKFMDHILVCKNVLLQKLELKIFHLLLPSLDQCVAQTFFPDKRLLQTALQTFKNTEFNSGVTTFINCLANAQNDRIVSLETMYITIAGKQYGRNQENERTYIDFDCARRTVTLRLLTQGMKMQPVSIRIKNTDIDAVFSKEFIRLDAAEVLIILKEPLLIKFLNHRVKNLKFRFNTQYLQELTVYKSNSFLNFFFGDLKVFQKAGETEMQERSDVSKLQSMSSAGHHLRGPSGCEQTSSLTSVTEGYTTKVDTVLSTSQMHTIISLSSEANISYSGFMVPCASTPDRCENKKLDDTTRMENDSSTSIYMETMLQEANLSETMQPSRITVLSNVTITPNVEQSTTLVGLVESDAVNNSELPAEKPTSQNLSSLNSHILKSLPSLNSEVNQDFCSPEMSIAIEGNLSSPKLTSDSDLVNNSIRGNATKDFTRTQKTTSPICYQKAPSTQHKTTENESLSVTFISDEISSIYKSPEQFSTASMTGMVPEQMNNEDLLSSDNSGNQIYQVLTDLRSPATLKSHVSVGLGSDNLTDETDKDTDDCRMISDEFYSGGDETLIIGNNNNKEVVADDNNMLHDTENTFYSVTSFIDEGQGDTTAVLQEMPQLSTEMTHSQSFDSHSLISESLSATKPYNTVIDQNELEMNGTDVGSGYFYVSDLGVDEHNNNLSYEDTREINSNIVYEEHVSDSTYLLIEPETAESNKMLDIMKPKQCNVHVNMQKILSDGLDASVYTDLDLVLSPTTIENETHASNRSHSVLTDKQCFMTNRFHRGASEEYLMVGSVASEEISRNSDKLSALDRNIDQSDIDMEMSHEIERDISRTEEVHDPTYVDYNMDVASSVTSANLLSHVECNSAINAQNTDIQVSRPLERFQSDVPYLFETDSDDLATKALNATFKSKDVIEEPTCFPANFQRMEVTTTSHILSEGHVRSELFDYSPNCLNQDQIPILEQTEAAIISQECRHTSSTSSHELIPTDVNTMDNSNENTVYLELEVPLISSEVIDTDQIAVSEDATAMECEMEVLVTPTPSKSIPQSSITAPASCASSNMQLDTEQLPNVSEHSVLMDNVNSEAVLFNKNVTPTEADGYVTQEVATIENEIEMLENSPQLLSQSTKNVPPSLNTHGDSDSTHHVLIASPLPKEVAHEITKKKMDDNLTAHATGNTELQESLPRLILEDCESQNLSSFILLSPERMENFGGESVLNDEDSPRNLGKNVENEPKTVVNGATEHELLETPSNLVSPVSKIASPCRGFKSAQIESESNSLNLLDTILKDNTNIVPEAKPSSLTEEEPLRDCDKTVDVIPSKVIEVTPINDCEEEMLETTSRFFKPKTLLNSEQEQCIQRSSPILQSQQNEYTSRDLSSELTRKRKRKHTSKHTKAYKAKKLKILHHVQENTEKENISPTSDTSPLFVFNEEKQPKETTANISNTKSDFSPVEEDIQDKFELSADEQALIMDALKSQIVVPTPTPVSEPITAENPKIPENHTPSLYSDASASHSQNKSKPSEEEECLKPSRPVSRESVAMSICSVVEPSRDEEQPSISAPVESVQQSSEQTSEPLPSFKLPTSETVPFVPYQITPARKQTAIQSMMRIREYFAGHSGPPRLRGRPSFRPLPENAQNELLQNVRSIKYEILKTLLKMDDE